MRTLCKVLKVLASGFYTWRDRTPSGRALANLALIEQIWMAYAYSCGTYSIPRIHAELR